MESKEPRELSASELAEQLLHLLQEAGRSPEVHQVLQALVLASIVQVADDDLDVEIEPGDSIAETLKRFWTFAYVEGFEDGRRGGADGNG